MNNTNLSEAVLSEVFSTPSGSIYQSDDEGCWYINFAGKEARYNYSCLKRLKKAVEAINIEQMLMDPSKGSDLAIISICACEHCYVLSAIEILAFKELLQGAFVMFELNHVLKNCLSRVI